MHIYTLATCYLWSLHTFEMIPNTCIVLEMMFLFWSVVSPPFENTTSYQTTYVRACNELTLSREYSVKFYRIFHMWVADLNHWTSSAYKVRSLPHIDGKAALCQLSLKIDSIHYDELYSGISFVQKTQLRLRVLRFPTPAPEMPPASRTTSCLKSLRSSGWLLLRIVTAEPHLKHLVALHLKPHLLL